MIVQVIPKKNHYHNTKSGKVKILTKGKIYNASVINYNNLLLHKYLVVTDVNLAISFEPNIFISIDKYRDKKINELLK